MSYEPGDGDYVAPSSAELSFPESWRCENCHTMNQLASRQCRSCGKFAPLPPSIEEEIA